MLPKAYDPQSCEDRIYKEWENSGAFRPESAKDQKADIFTISMPPPNATGQLHLGHAVMLALEDIFIRFNRMRGKRALWVPGTDHASIATETVVIKQIQKEEKIPDPRAKLGREELIRRIADFVGKSRNTIRSQIRKMGASCDWSRERYTLDPSLNRCVNEVFVKMFRDGLIYRGHRAVNWDPRMQTTVSDDEIEYVEEKAPYYTFQYGPFRISTARPETKFGDKYVVMHPNDKRYAKYKDGDTFTAEWINGPVKATVIKDKIVDPDFGTGVMTITPWHDMVDFELSERHHLEREQIIGFDGRLLPIAGEFAGMPIEEARPEVVEKLKSKGLLVSVDENYVHRVAVSYRGKGLVEPQIKEQWFIDVEKPVVNWKKKKMSLKAVLQDVIKRKDIRIIPERFEKVYFHWIDNLRDWCISRQIWWGHRVPVYYCAKCAEKELTRKKNQESGIRNQEKEVIPNSYFLIPNSGGDSVIASVTQIERCPNCSGRVTQDPDTLDTWFSSGLWTWSTLVNPSLADDFSLTLEDLIKKSPDFHNFHPTQILETAADILFFWVARMILMTTCVTGEIPFEIVYLHGLILDRNGEKMSKSHPETAIDPLDIIPKYGADALRLSMIVGQSPGNDSRLYEEKIAGYRNFINKLWNASRFVLLQCEQAKIDPKTVTVLPDPKKLSLADRAVLHASEEIIEEVTEGLSDYRLSDVGERLYSFVWDFFCDWYLELSKGNANHAVLIHVLRRILKLLHPYCPFVTEELWSSVKPTGSGQLISESWPTVKEDRKDNKSFVEFQVLVSVISAIRRLRAEQNVEAGKKADVTVYSKKFEKLLSSEKENISRLAHVGTLTFGSKPEKVKDAASAFLKDVEVHMSLKGLFDTVKLKAGLEKDQNELKVYVSRQKAKLGNDNFVKRAPAEVVATEKDKLKEAEDKLKKVEERLTQLSG